MQEKLRGKRERHRKGHSQGIFQMMRLQEKRLVKYEALVIDELLNKEARAFHEQQMELTDHFLDNWKKYD